MSDSMISLASDRRRGAIYLLVVLFLQTLISLPRLDRVFLEGRAHWTADSAYMTLRALHSLDGTLRSPWKLTGLGEYRYDAKGQPTGIGYYSHHPILAAGFFRVFASVFGSEHWVVRSYALLWSLGLSVVLFALLRRRGTDPEAAGALCLLYAVLPLFYNYQDAWKHESVAAFVVASAFWLALNLERGAFWRAGFAAAFALVFQAEWGVYAIGAGLWLWLWGAYPGQRRFLRGALALGAVSAGLNLWILWHLGFDAKAAQAQALYRMSGDMAGVGFRTWLSTQFGYLGMNFTPLGGLSLAALLFAALRAPRRCWREPLTALGLVCVASTAAWVAVFRNLSHVHHYHQWYLGLGFVLMLAGALERLRPRWGMLALAALLASSVSGAHRLERLIQDDDFVEKADILLLRAQTRRLLWIDGLSGPKDWWLSPQIALYCDPLYKSRCLGIPASQIRGGSACADSLQEVDPGSDVLVTRNSLPAAREAQRRLARLGVRRLRLRENSPVFSYWTLEK